MIAELIEHGRRLPVNPEREASIADAGARALPIGLDEMRRVRDGEERGLRLRAVVQKDCAGDAVAVGSAPEREMEKSDAWMERQ